MIAAGRFHIRIASPAPARSPARRRRSTVERRKAVGPMLKQSETSASKACCGSGSGIASATVPTKAATSRVKIASASPAPM